ncbi:hypothetical protein E4U16_008195 [Claviceps sp. LM84 group G4]|nr:hypothetical protein E4U16_008195 [Claviceps sp. LM84 group G4]
MPPHPNIEEQEKPQQEEITMAPPLIACVTQIVAGRTQAVALYHQGRHCSLQQVPNDGYEEDVKSHIAALRQVAESKLPAAALPDIWTGPGTDILHRVNSITTDTCSTMIAFWRLLNEDPLTAHIFTVPCDSHGLQLLVKDVVTSEPMKGLISKAQSIVSKFRSSPNVELSRSFHEYPMLTSPLLVT